MDPILEYITTHPDASPEEVCAAFGIPFDRRLWDATLAQASDAARRLESSPNPLDRRWVKRLD